MFTALVNGTEHMQAVHCSLSLRGELVDSSKLKLSLSGRGGGYLYNKEKCISQGLECEVGTTPNVSLLAKLLENWSE